MNERFWRKIVSFPGGQILTLWKPEALNYSNCKKKNEEGNIVFGALMNWCQLFLVTDLKWFSRYNNSFRKCPSSGFWRIIFLNFPRALDKILIDTDQPGISMFHWCFLVGGWDKFSFFCLGWFEQTVAQRSTYKPFCRSFNCILRS